MARSRRRGLRPRQVAKLVIFSALACGVAWLSLSDNLSRAFPNDFGSAESPPGVYMAANGEFFAREGRLSDETYNRIADAARRSPLDTEPFLLFGLRAIVAEDLPRAERLLEESRQRDPRFAMPRVLLVAVYLRTGRIEKATEEVATLVRVLPRAAQLLVPELARLAAAPGTRAAVEQAIGDQPIMAQVLALLVAQNVDPDILLALSARQPRLEDGRVAEWQTALLSRLVESGEVTRAFDIWRRFVGAAPDGLIYDPEFRGAPGPAPFNWELTGSAVGAAERAPGGGVDIEYYGRQAGTLARQLILLRPGRYRLELLADGAATGQGSRIVLKIACRGRDEPLLAIRLEQIAAAAKRLGGDFTVPAGCDAQWLSFDGEAVEFPTNQRARITGLSLRPAGG